MDAPSNASKQSYLCDFRLRDMYESMVRNIYLCDSRLRDTYESTVRNIYLCDPHLRDTYESTVPNMVDELSMWVPQPPSACW